MRKESLMNNSEIHYYLSGLKDLHELLQVVDEIRVETGMNPDVIKYRDKRMTYNHNDAKSLKAETMSEKMYIDRNQIS